MTNRECDVLIAEKVIGLKLPTHSEMVKEAERVWKFQPHAVSFFTSGGFDAWKVDGVITTRAFVEAYSNQIEHAMKVVECLKSEWQFALGWMEGKGRWQAGFWKDHKTQFEAEDDSPAKAICFAALRLKGMEIP